MKKALVSIKPSVQLLLSNRVNFLLALTPVFIGILVYSFLGMGFYNYVMGEGRAYLDTYITSNSWNSFVYYIMAAFLTVVLFFVVNWSFVIFISILSSPFNDLLSGRIEKLLIGENVPPLSSSFKAMLKNILWTIFNELKKILVIGFIAFCGFVLGYIPLLTPLSLIISALLIAAQFIDYSWSRNELKVNDCLMDLKKHFFQYTPMGVVFFFLISIPLINLLVPSLATSYFTVLWVKLNKQ